MSAALAYTSHADLGGQLGWGPVRPEAEAERFHAPWEARALALTLAMGATGAWNLDMGRSAREQLPNYLQLSYYEIWIEALVRLMLARGMLGPDEEQAGSSLHPAPPVLRVLRADAVAGVLARGSPTEREATSPARFAVGQAVRTRNDASPHHTRLPAYVRGRTGRVERVHGCHVFADAHAQGLGERPEWLYTVAFDGPTLWDEPGSQGVRVSVDAWESYLEAI